MQQALRGWAVGGGSVHKHAWAQTRCCCSCRCAGPPKVDQGQAAAADTCHWAGSAQSHQGVGAAQRWGRTLVRRRGGLAACAPATPATPRHSSAPRLASCPRAAPSPTALRLPLWSTAGLRAGRKAAAAQAAAANQAVARSERPRSGARAPPPPPRPPRVPPPSHFLRTSTHPSLLPLRARPSYRSFSWSPRLPTV